MVTALFGLALVKAILVALFYMHLKSETRILKWSVFIPMSIPAFYALILVVEAAWRMGSSLVNWHLTLWCLLLSTIPSVARACPTCAGTQEGGWGFLVIMFSMIFLPFGVVFVVYKVVKKTQDSSVEY